MNTPLSDINILTYFIILSLLFLIAVIAAVKKSNTLDQICLYATLIVSLFFYGLRENIGSDTAMYLTHFNSLRDYDSFPWGYSFYILMKGIKLLGDGQTFYILSTTLFALILLLISVSIFVRWPAKAICFMFFIFSFNTFDLVTNVYRQGVAATMILIGCYFLVKHKYIYALLFFAFSFGFHWSAALVLCFICAAFVISKNHRAALYLCIFSVAAYIAVIIIGRGGAFLITNFDEGGALSQLMKVDLNSKISAYIDGGVDGALFSMLNLPSRAKSLFDVLCVLIFSLVYICRVRAVRAQETKHAELTTTVIMFFTLLSIYNLIFIDMVWYIRNLYWAFYFIPLTLIYCMFFYPYKNPKNKNPAIVYISLSYYLFGVISLWRHTNLLNYKVVFPL